MRPWTPSLPARAALLLGAAALLAIRPDSARAQTANGAQFLMLDMGAKPASMGGAYTALSGDSNAVLWNPAGLLFIERPEATLMQNTWIDDFRLYYAAGARKLGDEWAGGMALANFDYGRFEIIDRYGRSRDGWYRAGDWLGAFSAARTLVPDRLSFGASMKFIRQTIETESAQSFATDLGLLWRMPRYSLGLVLQNMGPGVKFREESAPLPFTLRAGVSARPRRYLTLAMDVVKMRDTPATVRLGAEYLMGRPWHTGVALRAGYSSASGPAGGVNAGLGIVGERWELAYSWNPYGVLATGHWFGLTLKGDLIDKDQIEQRRISKSWERRVQDIPPKPVAEPMTEPPGARVQRMYREVLRWYQRESAAGRLDPAQRRAVLQRLITRYETLGVDVRSAQAELSRLQGGGAPAPGLVPDEFEDRTGSDRASDLLGLPPEPQPAQQGQPPQPVQQAQPPQPAPARKRSGPMSLEDEALQREIQQMLEPELQP